jgi:LPXTG-motif cell wall-anchored protein
VQDDSSLGSGRYLLALFALCLLALLVFATAVSAQDDTTGASQQAADPVGETTAETTSSASASASPAETTSSADAQTADVNRDADEFRCEFFLHVVRNDRGNVRSQYDEQITRRFERCLSKDVIPGTIVKRRLPNTGGVPLLVLGFPAIALVGAGILLARRR